MRYVNFQIIFNESAIHRYVITQVSFLTGNRQRSQYTRLGIEEQSESPHIHAQSVPRRPSSHRFDDGRPETPGREALSNI